MNKKTVRFCSRAQGGIHIQQNKKNIYSNASMHFIITTKQEKLFSFILCMIRIVHHKHKYNIIIDYNYCYYSCGFSLFNR